MVMLIFIFCVVAPIAWFGCLWYYDLPDVVVFLSIYGFIAAAIAAFSWAASASVETIFWREVFAAFFLGLGYVRMKLQDRIVG